MAKKLSIGQCLPCSNLAHNLQFGFHYVSRNWRKAAIIPPGHGLLRDGSSAKGGHPPGNVRFQQPFAWAATDGKHEEAAYPLSAFLIRSWLPATRLLITRLEFFHVRKRSHPRQRRPGIVRRHPKRKHPPARPHRADRLRELHLAGRHGSPGFAADQ